MDLRKEIQLQSSWRLQPVGSAKNDERLVFERRIHRRRMTGDDDTSHLDVISMRILSLSMNFFLVDAIWQSTASNISSIPSCWRSSASFCESWTKSRRCHRSKHPSSQTEHIFRQGEDSTIITGQSNSQANCLLILQRKAIVPVLKRRWLIAPMIENRNCPSQRHRPGTSGSCSVSRLLALTRLMVSCRTSVG